jgi:hypothetical protein
VGSLKVEQAGLACGPLRQKFEKAWPAIRLLPLRAQGAGPDGPYRRRRGIPVGHPRNCPSQVSSADASAVSPIDQAVAGGYRPD